MRFIVLTVDDLFERPFSLLLPESVGRLESDDSRLLKVLARLEYSFLKTSYSGIWGFRVPITKYRELSLGDEPHEASFFSGVEGRQPPEIFEDLNFRFTFENDIPWQNFHISMRLWSTNNAHFSDQKCPNLPLVWRVFLQVFLRKISRKTQIYP